MKVVLIVEDLPEEQQKAKQAVRSLDADIGHLVAANLSDAKRLANEMGEHIVGIVTDMHFPEDTDRGFKNPNGLSMLSLAVQNDIPVSVCTDIDHHYAHYVEDTVRAFSELAGYDIPLTLDRKDWNQAVSSLHSLIQKSEV